jgi:hypothetical protein
MSTDKSLAMTLSFMKTNSKQNGPLNIMAKDLLNGVMKKKKKPMAMMTIHEKLSKFTEPFFHLMKFLRRTPLLLMMLIQNHCKYLMR